jgi:hypothetical protein
MYAVLTCCVVQDCVSCCVACLQVCPCIQQQAHYLLPVEAHCYTQGADAALILGKVKGRTAAAAAAGRKRQNVIASAISTKEWRRLLQAGYGPSWSDASQPPPPHHTQTRTRSNRMPFR